MPESKTQTMGQDSFFGDYLYEQVIPQDLFLRLVRELVPWERYSRRLIRYHRGEGLVGHPPIKSAVVFKVLLLSYLHNLSERQVAEFCNLHPAAEYLLGLAVDERARLVTRPGSHTHLELRRATRLGAG